MIKPLIQFTVAVIISSLLTDVASAKWSIYEAYSNTDGSVQFIVLGHFRPDTIGIDTILTVGHDGVSSLSLTIPFDFANPTNPNDSSYILIGTQGFADLKLVKPDFVVPNGFLIVPRGWLTVGLRTHIPGNGLTEFADYDLPTDGLSAYFYLFCNDSNNYCEDYSFLPMHSFSAAPWAPNSLGESARLSIPPSIATSSPTPPAVAISPGFTGIWYDPAQVGHGIFIEVLSENRLLAWWFAYNPAGTEQAWFGGVGTYVGNTPVTIPVYQATGGRWIPNFDPSRIVNAPWGTLTLTFTDCNHGRADFNSTAGYGSGSMNLTRLTQPIGLACP